MDKIISRLWLRCPLLGCQKSDSGKRQSSGSPSGLSRKVDLKNQRTLSIGPRTVVVANPPRKQHRSESTSANSSRIGYQTSETVNNQKRNQQFEIQTEPLQDEIQNHQITNQDEDKPKQSEVYLKFVQQYAMSTQKRFKKIAERRYQKCKRSKGKINAGKRFQGRALLRPNDISPGNHNRSVCWPISVPSIATVH